MKEEAARGDKLPPLLGEPEREDLFEIHRAILEQEGHEPAEGLEPAPWWVWTISVLALFIMGYYLGRYGGAFSTDPHELYQKTAATRAAGPPPAPQGDLIFAAICAPCHQPTGLGVEGKYPPLAGSEWVLGPPEIPARIVLNGLQGPVTVRGHAFDREMPPQGANLSDAEIAAVLTFVRSSWGNKADPVTPELVSKARGAGAGRGPWTAAALRALEAAR